MASRRNWCKSARPTGFPSGGCPLCQADWPDARIALHVLSGGSTRQMMQVLISIKDDHATSRKPRFSFFFALSGRKTGSHFFWKCYYDLPLPLLDRSAYLYSLRSVQADLATRTLACGMIFMGSQGG